MARTDDRSAAYMPKALLVAAVLLTAGRVVDIAMSFLGVDVGAKESSRTPQAVAWHELPSLQTNSVEAVAPVEMAAPDLSPQTRIELDKTLRAATLAHKFVLYEFSARWSDPCKTMETTSLSNSQVKALINERFMPVRITDRHKETGRNPKVIAELQKKYRVFAFPTLVIVDETGHVVSTLIGNCNSLTTYRFLSRTLHSLDRRDAGAHHTGTTPGARKVQTSSTYECALRMAEI